ncbi:MAG: hypothetical protein IPI21_06510 [Propionivibrio sp.]|nr:hypothetical protein [Propionivibrio sp.]
MVGKQRRLQTRFLRQCAAALRSIGETPCCPAAQSLRHDYRRPARIPARFFLRCKPTILGGRWACHSDKPMTTISSEQK